MIIYTCVGLKTILNIDQDEYIATGNEAAGVRIVVHSQGNMPYPEDEGILGKTGMLTAIHISRVFMSIHTEFHI